MKMTHIVTSSLTRSLGDHIRSYSWQSVVAACQCIYFVRLQVLRKYMRPDFNIRLTHLSTSPSPPVTIESRDTLDPLQSETNEGNGKS